MPGCSFSEHVIGRGFRALTIENEFVSVTLLPEKGADIYSLRYKPRNLDVLWKSPWGLKPQGTGVPSFGASTETAWLENYEGGWQEIFPNGGDACVYKGAALNFHGEASTLPWDYTVRQNSASAITVDFCVRLYRSPFFLRRSVTVESSLQAVLLEEVIENQGEEDLHFMWGHHPAFGAPFLDGGCRLYVPARKFLTHDVEISSNSRVAPSVSGTWPQLTGKDGRPVNLSMVPPAGQRVTEFGYLCDLEEGWYGLVNPALGFGVGIAWGKAVFPYLWFWQELRGSFGYPWYGSCYVMAVEPFNSIPGSGLTRAIASGTAPILRAGGKLEARLSAVFFDAGEPQSISTDGVAKVRCV